MAYLQPGIQKLRKYLKILPQELRDEIQTFVFTADSQKRFVDERYKPPASLQVSRATRKQFAKSYYGNGIFVFESSRSPKPTAAKVVGPVLWQARSWLRSLDWDYRCLIPSLEFVLPLSNELHGDEEWRARIRANVIFDVVSELAKEVQVLFVDYFNGAICDVGRIVPGDSRDWGRLLRDESALVTPRN